MRSQVRALYRPFDEASSAARRVLAEDRRPVQLPKDGTAARPEFRADSVGVRTNGPTLRGINSVTQRISRSAGSRVIAAARSSECSPSMRAPETTNVPSSSRRSVTRGGSVRQPEPVNRLLSRDLIFWVCKSFLMIANPTWSFRGTFSLLMLIKRKSAVSASGIM